MPIVRKKLRRVEVLLDIGCGIMPQKYSRPLVHVCCEPFAQYVEVLRDKMRQDADRRYVILHATWAQAVEIFPEASVDSVYLIDVVEHLEKNEALALLRATERLCRKQLVVFTPLGFMPQSYADGKDAWGLDGAKWQEHISGWQPEDFGEGWTVYAAKDYHEKDHTGRVFTTPYGAMWAVKNMGRDSANTLQRIVFALHGSLGSLADFAFRAIRKLKRLMACPKKSNPNCGRQDT
jgi:hypothetical protein